LENGFIAPQTPASATAIVRSFEARNACNRFQNRLVQFRNNSLKFIILHEIIEKALQTKDYGICEETQKPGEEHLYGE
jgi:hypothetical protein